MDSHNPWMARDVGVRLRHARKLRGLTQQELAKAAGVPQSAISEVETGESKSPSGTNLVSIAFALKVSPGWLAQGKGQMDATETPLPHDAMKVARDWLKLAPEVRLKVADMIREMVKQSSADAPAVSDQRVADSYGRPGEEKQARKAKR